MEQIHPGIYRIPVPVPFEVDPVNVYLLTGATPTVIDTGLPTPEAMNVLQDALQQVGLNWRSIKQILLTHGHIDHFGLAPKWQELSGVPIRLHPVEHEAVESFYYQNDQTSVERSKNQLFHFGAPEPWVRKVTSLRQRIIDFVGSKKQPHLELLTDEEWIEAGDIRLQVIHTPGHSPGQVVFLAPEIRLAFTGDHLLAQISPNPDMTYGADPVAMSGLPDYIASLIKLKNRLETGIKAFGGHGPAIEEPLTRIDEIIEMQQARTEHFDELLRAYGPVTAYELSDHFLEAIGKKTSLSNEFLAIKETVGHLALLQQRGQLAWEEKSGVCYYRLAG